MSDLPYPIGIGYPEQANPGRSVSMRTRIDMRIAQCQQQLEDAKRAKEIFEASPDLEELINILNRAGF